MTRKVSTLILRASKVSSGTAMAAAMDESLNIPMKVLPSEGRALRSMIGATTETLVCSRVSPIERAASITPFGTESSPARNTSVR